VLKLRELDLSKVPVADFTFKASKDSQLESFATWMKKHYSEPRQPGQRGAARIKEGMNPKTFIPIQIESIISTGKISEDFLAEIERFKDSQKYEGLTQDEIFASLKKIFPQDFDQIIKKVEQAKADAHKTKVAAAAAAAADKD